MSTKHKGKVATSARDGILPIVIVVGFALLAVLLMVLGDRYANRKTGGDEMTAEEKKEQFERDGWYDYTEHFGKGLDKDGTLADIDAKDYVTLCDYEAIELKDGAPIDRKNELRNYLLENCVVKECPEYKEMLQERIRFVLTKSYERSEQVYYEAHGEYQFKDIYAAYNVTEEEFNEAIVAEAEAELKKFLILEVIFEKEGFEVTEADIVEWVESCGYKESDVEAVIYQHGRAYVNRMTMETIVLRELEKRY